MKPIEIAHRGSILFALLHNSCSNPTIVDGVNIYEIDLHCDIMEIAAEAIYGEEGVISLVIYSMNRILGLDKKQPMTHPTFYEAVIPMSDPYGKVTL